MQHTIPAISGAEQDVFSRRARRMLIWTQRAGATASVKRQYRRRERHLARLELATRY